MGRRHAARFPENGSSETDPDREGTLSRQDLPGPAGHLGKHPLGTLPCFHRTAPDPADPPARVPEGNLHLGPPRLDP